MTEEKKPEEYPIKENNLNEISSEIIDVEKEVFKKVEQKEPEESKIIKQEKIEREKEESKETGKTETKENFLSRLRRKKLKEQFYPNIKNKEFKRKDILLPNSRSKKEITISKKSYIILIIIIATLTILLALSVVWRNINTNKLIELISEKEFSVKTGDTNVTIQPAQVTDADTNNNFYNYTINNTINCPEVVCNCA